MALRGQATASTIEDVVTDDRLRHLANLPGHYFLDKWRNTHDRQVSAFACRIQRISPRSVSLAAPVSGDVDDLVCTHFDAFGVLRGHITRRLGFGFVMSLKLSEAERERLAAKIIWLEKHRNFEVTELRRYKRIVPKSPQSTLVLADGTALDCFVIDMSVSGAAVSADCAVEIGTPMALGTVVGRVVRHLSPGFALEFIEAIDETTLETRLIRHRDQLRLG